MTLSLSPDQRVDLAERLDLDPWTMSYETIAARFSEMQRRAGRRVERSFADAADPSGILKLDRDVPLDDRSRAMAGRDDPAEAVLDAAVGRGAIPSADRAAWLSRLRRSPEAVSDVLNSLPGDPALAERAYAEDRRLRALGDQLDDLLGVSAADRVVQYAADDDELRDPTGLLDLS